MPNIKYSFSFSEEDIEELNEILVNSKPNSKLALRANILLTLCESQNKHLKTEEIASICHTTITTVQTVRSQYATEGLYATLYPRQRDLPPVVPITYGIEDKVISLVLSDPPQGYKRWTEVLLTNQC